jgi:hypothetical protein
LISCIDAKGRAPRAATQKSPRDRHRHAGFFIAAAFRPTASSSRSEAHVHAFCSDVDQANIKRRPAMFDVIPYWMWVVSLIVLAVMCGAALSFEPPKFRAARRGLHGLCKLHRA